MSLSALLGVIALAGAAQAQVVTRKPYIQQGSPTSAVVAWRTLPASESVVRYGLDPGRLDQIVAAPEPVIHHEVRLQGLEPDTRYFYSVGTRQRALAGGDTEHSLRTAPLPGARRRLRIWAVGDSGTGGEAQRAVRDAMLSHVGDEKPDVFIHLGDMAYRSGESLEFEFRFFDVYAPILRNTVVWPTLGNHEGRSSSASAQRGPYFDGFALPTRGECGGVASGTEAYYSFDFGNVHFIVLDSTGSPRGPEGEMLRWLRRDLAGSSADWMIAFWHHPPYSKGSHDSDRERELVEMRQSATPILEAAGVDLVLGGHSHAYERSFLIRRAAGARLEAEILDGGDGRVEGDGAYRKARGASGAVYVVAGHGGAPVSLKGHHPLMRFVEAKNGSCLIDVEGDALTLTNLRADGQITDRFTILKGAAEAPRSPSGGDPPGESADPVAPVVVRPGALIQAPGGAEAEGGCGCALAGGAQGGAAPWAVGLGLAAVGWRRRRRAIRP